MAFAVTFGGQTIDDIAEWSERLPSRVTPETFPRKHGGLVSNLAWLGTRTITVTGEVQKTSETNLRNYLNSLNFALTNKGRAPLVLRDDLRFINAIKSHFGYRFIASRLPSQIAQFDIDFICDDPFWYKTSQSTGTLTFETGGVISPVMDNFGQESTPPVITFSSINANRTDFTLTNTTIGMSMRYAGTVEMGKSLIVDCDKFTVTNNGANALKDFSGSFFDLVPGSNNFALTGPQTDLTFAWRERWL